MANAVSKRFAPAAPTHAETKEEAPLAQVDAKIEKFKESLFSTPWSKVGYDMGYALGFAAVNILMLVFSGGVGNALTKLGSFLGELGGVLGSAGKLVTVLGRGIMFVEEAINAVMNVAMKPLQPLLRALEPHLQKLVVFLRKLLGVAEKEGAEALAAAAKTTAGLAKPKPPPVHLHAPKASPLRRLILRLRRRTRPHHIRRCRRPARKFQPEERRISRRGRPRAARRSGNRRKDQGYQQGSRRPHDHEDLSRRRSRIQGSQEWPRRALLGLRRGRRASARAV